MLASERVRFGPAPKRWAGWLRAALFALAWLLLPVFSSWASLGQEPPRVTHARRLLAQRGWKPGQCRREPAVPRANGPKSATQAEAQTQASATWTALGPTAVLTPNYGLVTGRVSSLALDPADATGNRLYIGTTGGGVWVAQNAATSAASNVLFTPLTDTVAAFTGAVDPSISIGALTVQPGGTGVILAGTGDPNDALDSYYGAGILRSADNGNTWSLIQTTADFEWSFTGEGFAGFAWSTVNPQLVVAAVSQAYEGTLVNAVNPDLSYQGLYYSLDSGAHWSLATITDGIGADVQGPSDAFALPDGNAATSVVWNPVRQVFVAAVRFHGYYQSTDGITWTRMAAQPGAGLTPLFCPNNLGSTGSIDCPIFRGTLAVNPQTGDTFAWTVDLYNQDQGLWQDQCAIGSGACASQSIAFARQWSTAALQTSTMLGRATIANGDYNLSLAAVPFALGQGMDTWLLAGANDLWKCSLAMGCVWRNTTNAFTCMSAQVAAYQHALAWSTTNPLEIFLGNDSGLWRSMDAIGESGSACAATDANHFQNLNGSLGSLAEVTSVAQAADTPTILLAGLGVNGSAGAESAGSNMAEWPQVLSGWGGPVAIDPVSNAWYVNAEAGVSIYRCTGSGACAPSEFGVSPAVTDADVGGDGYTMTTPAPFLIDPVDNSQLLVGTCRVWRGRGDGAGWTAGSAISPIFDGGAAASFCDGDSQIRTMAAMALPGGEESIYVGLYGAANGSTQLPGHILTATYNPASANMPAWTDLTLNPVTNDTRSFNRFGLDVSSIAIDVHDPSGNTLYATVQGTPDRTVPVQTVYRSTDGGAHWTTVMANLPWTPANSLIVDPQAANTVYVATDAGVFISTQIASCATSPASCWSAFGSALPAAPVVELGASSPAASQQMLMAATYGRGIWQAPLWSAGTPRTTATASPASLSFPNQVFGTASSVQTVTLADTGSVPLTATSIAMSGDFSETDNCQNIPVPPGTNCAIQIAFTPTATGSRTGQITIAANVSGGQLIVSLSGMGIPPSAVNLTPATVNFGPVEVGVTSPPFQVEAANSGSTEVPITGIAVTPPFSIASNACGVTSLAAETDCQLMLEFTPTQVGAASGTLTLTDGAGTQFVTLTGTGLAPPTDALTPASLSFLPTVIGQISGVQTVSLTNTGDLPLTSIAVSASGPFQTENACGTQLVGHAVCAIGVNYAPSQAGAQSGILTVSDLLRTQTVSLSGTGLLVPEFSVNPTSLSFALQTVGQPSAPQTLTVTNTGGAPMANVGFQFTGQGANSFSIGSTTCGATLNSATSCTVQVIFTPTTAGGSAANLVFSSSTQSVNPVSVPVSGSATATTGLNVSPSQLTFAAVLMGQASAAQTVTIGNTGSLAATSLTLTAGAPFSLTQNTCASNLAGGASCTVGVVFTPTGVGPVTGALTVTSATVKTPATVLLSGTGAVAAAIQVTPASIVFATTAVGASSSPTTVTVTNSGATAPLSNLALAVPAGFELVNNTCAAMLAAGGSCTAGVEFAPTVAGAQTGNLTVTSSTVTAAVQVLLSGVGFDFTVTGSGSTSQSVASGQTALYSLVMTPLGGTPETFTFQCGSLPTNALCLFNPPSEILDSAAGNVTVEISTGQSGSSARWGGAAGLGVLTVAFALLLPFRLRRRRAILLAASLVILVGSIADCTSSGGGLAGGGGSSGGGNSGSTPVGTYSIPVTVTSAGVQHSLTLTLTVD